MKHQTQTMKKAARSVAAIMFASLMGVSPVLIADGANARSDELRGKSNVPSNEKKRFDMSVFSTFPSPFEDNIPTPGRNVTPLEFCMEVLGKEDKERLKRCHLYFRGPREPTTLYHNQAFYI